MEGLAGLRALYCLGILYFLFIGQSKNGQIVDSLPSGD